MPVQPPNNPHDVEAIDLLALAENSEIEPLIPELLKYLEDINWSVFSPIVQLLSKRFTFELVNPIKQLLNNNQNNSIINDFLIGCFILIKELPIEVIQEFLPEIENQTLFPTKGSVGLDYYFYAADIIFEYFSDENFLLKDETLVYRHEFEELILNLKKVFLSEKTLEIMDSTFKNYKNMFFIDIIFSYKVKSKYITKIYLTIMDEDLAGATHLFKVNESESEETQSFCSYLDYFSEKKDFEDFTSNFKSFICYYFSQK